MSRALKCDYCGRLYEPYAVDQVNEIAEVYYDADDREHELGCFDMCPECNKSYFDWKASRAYAYNERRAYAYNERRQNESTSDTEM
jgi:hypothetical protein